MSYSKSLKCHFLKNTGKNIAVGKEFYFWNLIHHSNVKFIEAKAIQNHQCVCFEDCFLI